MAYAHLRRRLGLLNDSIVMLNHLGSNDSAQRIKNQNHLVITLVNLEYEMSKAFHTSHSTTIRKNPPQRFVLILKIFIFLFIKHRKSSSGYTIIFIRRCQNSLQKFIL